MTANKSEKQAHRLASACEVALIVVAQLVYWHMITKHDMAIVPSVVLMVILISAARVGASAVYFAALAVMRALSR